MIRNTKKILSLYTGTRVIINGTHCKLTAYHIEFLDIKDECTLCLKNNSTLSQAITMHLKNNSTFKDYKNENNYTYSLKKTILDIILDEYDIFDLKRLGYKIKDL